MVAFQPRALIPHPLAPALLRHDMRSKRGLLCQSWARLCPILPKRTMRCAAHPPFAVASSPLPPAVEKYPPSALRDPLPLGHIATHSGPCHPVQRKGLTMASNVASKKKAATSAACAPRPPNPLPFPPQSPPPPLPLTTPPQPPPHFPLFHVHGTIEQHNNNQQCGLFTPPCLGFDS